MDTVYKYTRVYVCLIYLHIGAYVNKYPKNSRGIKNSIDKIQTQRDESSFRLDRSQHVRPFRDSGIIRKKTETRVRDRSGTRTLQHISLIKYPLEQQESHARRRRSGRKILASGAIAFRCYLRDFIDNPNNA